MSKNRFPAYKPEQKNSMVIVISDKTIHDELTNKDVVEILKDMTDVNNFFDKLQAFCKQNGFEIDASGTREQMAARLYKKDGAELITQADALDFAIKCYTGIADLPGHEPTIEELHEFLMLRG